MPFKYRDFLNEKWLNDHCRVRNGYYEIRCMINGVNITGSGKVLEDAITRFMDSLLRLENNKKQPKPSTKAKANNADDVFFVEFAERWLEIAKKPTVKAITYRSVCDVLRKHVKPFFANLTLREITALQIQPLFNDLINDGKTRTAGNIKVILNQIFKAAIAERIIQFNPMDNVKVVKHQSVHGVALSYDEERALIAKIAQSKYKLTFALMLYCGMRRAELRSIQITDKFVIIKNGKSRFAQPETVRKVPITPMLRPYLDDASTQELEEATRYSCDLLSRAFKALCPDHHLHELRHTFVTRCQECGVSREVVSVWAGHAADNTMTSTVYTHFSDEFMLSEGKKVDYFHRLI